MKTNYYRFSLKLEITKEEKKNYMLVYTINNPRKSDTHEQISNKKPKNKSKNMIFFNLSLKI